MGRRRGTSRLTDLGGEGALTLTVVGERLFFFTA